MILDQQCRRAQRAKAREIRESKGDVFDVGAEAGSRLFQFEKYVHGTFDIAALMSQWTDGRVDPTIPTFQVTNALFHAAVLREPSMNSLVGNLAEPDFQRLLGYEPRPGQAPFSGEPIVKVLDTLCLDDVTDTIVDTFWRAERNQAFRDGWHNGLRVAAIDGWEPYCSYQRHCEHCLTREIEYGGGRKDGTRATKTQYYHRYVVAFLVGPHTEVVLGVERLRTRQERIADGDTDAERAEGEETAAKRLLEKLKAQYGTFIDAFLLDGLYADGPLFTKVVKELNYSAIVVLKNPKQQPLKFAEEIFEHRQPTAVIDDPKHHETVELWDIDNVTTMANYDGPVRVIKAVNIKTKPKPKPRQVKTRAQRRLEKRQEALRQRQRLANRRSQPVPAEPVAEGPKTTTTWCMALVGEKVSKISAQKAHRLIRGRWHIENTLFHQWVVHWNLDHVYRHTPNALMAVILIWALAFNLMQYFLFCRLQRPRRPKKKTDTTRHIIDVMRREVGALTSPIPWGLVAEYG